VLKIFHPETIKAQSSIQLQGKEAHHLFHVLRGRDGERVIVLNGQGYYGEGHILDRRMGTVAIDELHYREKPKIYLYPALLKSKAMDFLIREATAIGVAEIIPFVTQHSAVKMNVEMAKEKKLHWDNIAKEACKQSGNPWLPAIEIPKKFAQISLPRPTLIASLRGERTQIFSRETIIRNSSINLVIGPEGDFSEEEYECFIGENTYFIQLGKNVLRSEIAALYLLSVVDHIMGENEP
jgi:16S rRNA (uracil1498-N3)-methyltransferase